MTRNSSRTGNRLPSFARRIAPLGIGAVCLFAGCEVSEPAQNAPSGGAPSSSDQGAFSLPHLKDLKAPEAAADDPNSTFKPFAPGATGKGNYEKGPITTPVSVYFKAKEWAVAVQLKQAMDLYQATNGNYPRDMAEFKSQILDANHIKLPDLPTGHEYVYDPAQGQLFVKEPAAGAADPADANSNPPN